MCDQKWSEVLPEMLPAFISCENTDEYICTCLRLVTKIDDSHAQFNAQNFIFSLRLGMLRMPFEARFFENKLVITTFTGDDAQVKEKLQIFIYEYIVYLRFIRLRSRQYKEVLTMPNGFDGFISLVLNGRASEVDIENGLRLFGSSESVNHVFYEFLRSIDVRLRAVQVS